MVREELLADVVVVSRESSGACDWLMLKRGRSDSKNTKKFLEFVQNSKGKKELIL